MSDGFDPSRSTATITAIADFISNPNMIDLTTVPGCGAANIRLLNDAGIFTVYQLMGQFLMLKGPDDSSIDHCDKLWHWMRGSGVNSARNNIIEAIASKANVYFPNIYDASQYEA